MARMTVKAGTEYAQKLAALSGNMKSVAEKAVYEAAGIVADQIRKNLTENINDDRSAAKRDGPKKKKEGQESSGDLLDSLGIAPIQMDKYGYIGTKIGFDGYDRRGVPNPLKARVMECRDLHFAHAVRLANVPEFNVCHSIFLLYSLSFLL